MIDYTVSQKCYSTVSQKSYSTVSQKCYDTVSQKCYLTYVALNNDKYVYRNSFPDVN